MILDKNAFSILCKENQGVFEIDQSYPPDPEMFEKWIANHKDGLPKDTAMRFREATRHVSSIEFFQTYHKVCEEIIEHVRNKQYKNVIFYVHTEDKLTKSNFWLSLYLFPIIENMIDFVITDIEYDLSALNDILQLSQKDEKTLLIIPDDASYSGDQMSGILEEINHFDQLDIMVAVAFISEYAIDAYQKIDKNRSLHLCIPTIADRNKFRRFNLPEEMYPFEPKSPHNLLYTIYFDHKLPDILSVYQPMYAIGKGFGKVEQDYIFEPMSLIKGCDTHKKIKSNPYLYASNELFTIDLKHDMAKGHKLCPSPIYKDFNYTYQNQLIHEIDILEITIDSADKFIDNFWEMFDKKVKDERFDRITDLLIVNLHLKNLRMSCKVTDSIDILKRKIAKHLLDYITPAEVTEIASSLEIYNEDKNMISNSSLTLIGNVFRSGKNVIHIKINDSISDKLKNKLKLSKYL